MKNTSGPTFVVFNVGRTNFLPWSQVPDLLAVKHSRFDQTVQNRLCLCLFDWPDSVRSTEKILNADIQPSNVFTENILKTKFKNYGCEK